MTANGSTMISAWQIRKYFPAKKSRHFLKLCFLVCSTGKLNYSHCCAFVIFKSLIFIILTPGWLLYSLEQILPLLGSLTNLANKLHSVQRNYLLLCSDNPDC